MGMVLVVRMVVVVVAGTAVDKKVRRGLHALVPLAPPKEAAVVEHVLGHRVQGPVITLARVTRFPRNLDEAIVE